MCKKRIFLLIALLAVGLTVVHAGGQAQGQGEDQGQAMDPGTVEEIERLTKDFQAGKITAPEYQRRMTEIQNRTASRNQGSIDMGNQQRPQVEQQLQQQQAQQTQQQGANAGWPSAAVFRQYEHEKLSVLRQPAGTTSSYSTNGEFIIILSNGNANTVIQDLVSQIERAFNVKAKVYQGEYDLDYNVDRYGNGQAIRIWQENGVVKIQPWYKAG